ncbi:Secreted protein containing cell-adhesion domains [Bacillus sp. NRRL B-14911]|uniref:PKD domain-containing protein n=1 Tax=Bacillus sp. NRRL B-14911 TaxID=313627 RepID=UPI00006B59D4|nr:PKD domain-containing protein [Bacillus sp. NRRL B-14911]EAR66189.1 Secreted protein containing cell-adhesion domains [Bacillus sp. NRRL B-14911]
MKKKLNRKFKLGLLILSCAVLFINPQMANALALIGDYANASPKDFYRTDNMEIPESNLVYTGASETIVQGEKSGKLLNGVILRAANDSKLGYTFFYPNQLRSIAASINGNPDYVESRVRKTQIARTNGTGTIETWVWSRDIGRAAGATVDLVDVPGQVDESGAPKVKVIFNATKSPAARFSNDYGTTPSTAKKGEEIFLHVFAQEYDPYRSQIKWDLAVDGKIVDSADGLANTSFRSIPYTFDTEGIHNLTLTVTDGIERQTVKTHKINIGLNVKPPPPEKENAKPIASVNVEPYFYWPETVTFTTGAYDPDPDGEIASEQLYVDGVPIDGKTWNSSRVTEKTPHQVDFVVEDNMGETASDSDTFEIWPTIPKAEVKMEGELKQNRALTFDAKASDLVSPIEFAPIEYSLTKWNIVPVSDGLTNEDVKIRPDKDPSLRKVLFKKPGTYELHLTVTNKFNEESEVLIKELVVRPDEKPFARFTVDKAVYLRDQSDGNQATITLTDGSVSMDGDTIAQRIWYKEFDANNDGIFGTAADGGKEILDSGNKTSITFKTNHVGNYRFSLEVKEAFGAPTYEEFILPEEYLTDTSDVIDEAGTVSVYLDPGNFNIPTSDKGVKVDNAPPVIDFGVKRQNSIHLALDFGGMDIAALNHKTGPREGAGVNNGGGGGNYDHYYYDVNSTAKNKLTAYAGSLEADLRQKGLDATVSVNSCYFEILDLDGECATNVPVWNWVDRGNYVYDSYSGTSPYSGSWEVTSSGSNFVATWCYEVNYAWSDKEQKMVPVEHSHAPPCSNQSNATGYTEYWASLRSYVSDYRFEITSYTNEGCGPDNRPGNPETDPDAIDSKINTTDFTDGFNSFSFNQATYKYYFRMDHQPWTWINDSSKKNLVTKKIQDDNIFFWSNSNNSLRDDARSLINSTGRAGTFSQYNTSSLQQNIQMVQDYLLNKFMIEEDSETFTIVLGDQLDYTTAYQDYENDPELQREWKFDHDPTSVNGRKIDAAPSSPIAQSGLYINQPIQLNEVGTYSITLRAKDNPLTDIGNDLRFTEYQKWSDEEIVREYKVNVHRRPIADFTAEVEPGTLRLSLDPYQSYDPDHQYNWSSLGIAEKGIVEYSWEKYVVDDVEHTGAPPEFLEPLKDYYITLRVKDIDGAYGYTTKLVSTKTINLKPIALFDSPSTVLRTDRLNDPTTTSYIYDRSYDPNGDPLTNYNWTIKRQSDGLVVWNGSTPPVNFAAINLPAGKYMIGLTVWDIPKYPPALQSDLYEREITVLTNNPPKSCFDLSRTIINKSTISCVNYSTSPHTLYVDEPAIYTGNSSDPDGHNLINYSWKVELLGELNKVVQTWNTGAPPINFSQFAGAGKYRVTQTVFDEPPAPLPSLKGTQSKTFNVIKGPQAPYALFDYDPLLPIEGQTVNLNDLSYDEDGQVTRWEWKIEAPNGTITTQTEKEPSIPNSVAGIYKITLNVWDDTNLKSKLPAYKEITVTPKPANKPPVSLFVWEPFKPFIGEELTLNPDGSYDLDGTIVTYQWQIRGKDSSTYWTTEKYPTFVAQKDYYDVTLTVRDNLGASSSKTERIYVNVANLTPLVTHTDDWKQYWLQQGYEADVNMFHAGEKFIIELKTTPAQRVEGKVNFGGKIGEVTIPSSAFNLIGQTQYEYTWRAELWREDFINIADGEYLFEFTGYHPENNPYVQSKGTYIIEIFGSIYDSKDYHRRF